MARKCDTKLNLNYRGIKAQSKDRVIFLEVTETLETCNEFSTENNIIVDAADTQVTDLTNIIFRTADVPEDKIACSGDACYNTGALTGEAAGTGAFVAWEQNLDANQIANGVFTAYVNVPAAGTFPVTLSIGDYGDDGTFTDSDAYTVNVVAADAGWQLVKIDLSNVPDVINGTGWDITSTGVSYQLSIDSGLTAGDEVAFSSVSIYESLEDMEVYQRIALTCVQESGGDTTHSILDSACDEASYDETGTTKDIAITAMKVSDNYLAADPTIAKSEEDTIIVPANKTITVEAGVNPINGEVVGTVQVSDLYEDDCGRISVVAGGACVGNGMLSNLGQVGDVALEKDQFVTSNSTIAASEKGKVYFSEDMIGEEVQVIYNVETTVSSKYCATNSFRDIQVRAVEEIDNGNGQKSYIAYNNLQLTGITGTNSSSSETGITFSFRVSPDGDDVRECIANV